MTRKELNVIVSGLKEEALLMVKNSSPILTGNLQNSVYARDIPGGGFEIYIDTSQAPYAIYTLEQWVSPQWKGKKNPNEGWAYEASKGFATRVQNKLKGVK